MNENAGKTARAASKADEKCFRNPTLFAEQFCMKKENTLRKETEIPFVTFRFSHFSGTSLVTTRGGIEK